MIPKKIHYCWFGNKPLPNDVKKYIESWKKYCPEYEIIEWNEKNYNVDKCKFIKDAYQAKKWAFVSDYARLDIIYNEGGVYLDTDVELIKNIDKLLNNDAFMCFESTGYVATGLGFGAVAGNRIIKENLDAYNNIEYIQGEEGKNHITCPYITTKVLKNNGLKAYNNKIQELNEITVLPTEYLCPIDFNTGEMNITSNTYSIHHYSMSWIDENEKKWYKFQQRLSSKVGIKFSKIIIKILKTPYNIVKRIKKIGFKKSFNYYLSKIRKKK